MRYWIAITMVRGLLKSTAIKLLQRFGSPEAVFDRCARSHADEIPPGALRSIKAFTAWERVDRELNMIEEGAVSVVTYLDSDYPARLKEVPDPPLILYTKGKIDCLKNKKAVAVEGTRLATPGGLGAARALAGSLASSGVAVVSGMARGCDGAAHSGALGAGGFTIAVLGTGVDVPYPKENKGLYGDILKSGLVISELPMGTTPVPKNFLRRNRIINGISTGIVVVEANMRSGSMMTARLAFENNRPVFIPAGNMNPAMEKLRAKGAVTVRGASDIIKYI